MVGRRIGTRHGRRACNGNGSERDSAGHARGSPRRRRERVIRRAVPPCPAVATSLTDCHRSALRVGVTSRTYVFRAASAIQLTRHTVPGALRAATGRPGRSAALSFQPSDRGAAPQRTIPAFHRSDRRMMPDVLTESALPIRLLLSTGLLVLAVFGLHMVAARFIRSHVQAAEL